jgi:hypothetical protein
MANDLRLVAKSIFEQTFDLAVKMSRVTQDLTENKDSGPDVQPSIPGGTSLPTRRSSVPV